MKGLALGIVLAASVGARSIFTHYQTKASTNGIKEEFSLSPEYGSAMLLACQQYASPELVAQHAGTYKGNRLLR